MEWLLLSLLPVLENRAAIPLGILSGYPPLLVWFLASMLSAITGFLAYTVLRYGEPLLLRLPLVSTLYSVVVERVRGKLDEVKGVVGILLFVSLPIPGSGVYTGAILSHLLGMRPIPTLLALTVGSLLAGLVVTLSVLGVLVLLPPMSPLTP